jgi:hypothetical protein
MEQKRNIPVILGILIPIAMVLFVAGSIYLPRLFAEKPTYDFVYVTDPDYWGDVRFSVVNGRLTKKPVLPADPKYPTPPSQDPRIFIHRVGANKSEEVTFEEAAKLNLDSKLESPDGFTVTQGSGGGDFFPFFFDGGNDYYGRYIQGHGYRERLNLLPSRGYDYYGNFQFMGWINK